MSAPWTILHELLGTKLLFSTAYHPKTDALAESPIQTPEDMIRKFHDYFLKLKDSDCFTHYWYTLMPELQLAYKTSIHASTSKTPAILEKRWNPKLPVDTMKKDSFDIHPSASSFKILLDKVRNHENQIITDAFEYARQKLNKSDKTPELKLGDLILVSTLDINNIKGQKKFKY
ncbi:hypothetical protein O181_103494 [Austropuccinia psidii MF-1]|uniref:Integrase catalytic domain-containing protein n=1 Tax=Austropuccinia psidii MF-1 TaxID=1389203 RepID=A0A9Q3PJA4_9BASI|nr:hypothetical protein [Austropuccinia psidii MF-1]